MVLLFLLNVFVEVGDSIVVLGGVEGELGSQSTSLAADSVGEL